MPAAASTRVVRLEDAGDRDPVAADRTGEVGQLRGRGHHGEAAVAPLTGAAAATWRRGRSATAAPCPDVKALTGPPMPDRVPGRTEDARTAARGGAHVALPKLVPAPEQVQVQDTTFSTDAGGRVLC